MKKRRKQVKEKSRRRIMNVHVSDIQPLTIGQEVTMNGIEKYRGSDARGKMVTPHITIWDKVTNSRRPVALAEHGEKATLVDLKKSKRGVLYYRVQLQTDDEPVVGWVMFPFVDEAVGENGYGEASI